jgi:hypothetical protein
MGRKSHLNSGKDNELLRNASGYVDPTAYQAIKKVDAELDEESWRFHGLLDIIFDIMELSDFELIGRITVKDKRTGKVWK